MTAGRPVSVDAPPIVMKFGGSAFLDLDGYRLVADYVAGRVTEYGRRAIVVVSAMSGTTGRLQEALREVHETPPPAVSSMILTTGEVVSVALLTAVLDTHGIAAHGLTGDQVGMVADGPPDRARLRAIDPQPLTEALSRSPVVVVPGGQAVNVDGQLVMLGRNSSDLSAVAAAVAVGAETCEMFSDVPGICSADPYMVPTARVLPEINFDTMRFLADSGAKVIQGEALRWAQEHGVRIRCRSLPPAATCATVVATGPSVGAVALHQRGDVWTFPDPDSRAVAAKRLRQEGLDALILEQDDSHLVATAYGSTEIAARCCADGELRPDRCLLTVLHPTSLAERMIVPRADGVAEARRRHDQLYPPVPATLTASVPKPIKPRSMHSGLLLGGVEI
jgi:aspartate kinase